jgi:hypothetical protein
MQLTGRLLAHFSFEKVVTAAASILKEEGTSAGELTA